METDRYVLSDKAIEDKSSIQGQYGKLEIDREPYLSRARDCSELTIPTFSVSQFISIIDEASLKFIIQTRPSLAIRSIFFEALEIPLTLKYSILPAFLL